MIQNLRIKNFKSIKDIAFNCRKLNVIIGEPNSGKSNIIEALALKSQNAFGPYKLNQDMFRYRSIGDLFFDFDINQPIDVLTDRDITQLKYAVREDGAIENRFDFTLNEGKGSAYIYHDGTIQNRTIGATEVKYYEFRRLFKFETGYMPHLAVPFGENLPSLLLANSEYKKWVSEFFKSKGLNLTLKPTENEILASKITNDEIYSYSYFTLSETLQRIVFYTLAMKTNRNSVLLFDEPETNTFPPYTKQLAERIALDETNQFFITTHNPYLLLNLIEKSSSDNINVIISQMIDFQTKITVLNTEQIGEILNLNSDVFFNFEKILSL